MAVITRWSYKRGGGKAGFHCTCNFVQHLYLTVILEIKGGEDPGIHTIYMGKPAKYGWKITFRVITLGKFQKKMGGHLRRCIFFSTPQVI